jgi:cysteine desulfurase/selenocysteine lyase
MLNMLNTNKSRHDFPIFTSNPELVYLDSAATSQKPRTVIDAVNDFYSNKNSNVARGLYRLAEDATVVYEEVRQKARKFINARESNEIVFTNNTTYSINTVMRGWGEKFVKKGDKIVVTVAEHHSNFVPWQFLAKSKKAKFEVVDVDDEGELDLGDFEKKCKGAKLVAVSCVSNVLGTVNDVKKLGQIAHENGAILVVDGAQSVPSMPTDVRKLNCDFLAFSGHKMLAPFGVGVLYGKAELLEKMDPAFYGSQMIREVSAEKTTWNSLPYKFETGTPEVSAVVGLGAAIDYLNSICIEEIYNHETKLTSYLLSELSNLEKINILGPKDAKKRNGLVSFIIDKVHPHDVAALLAESDICVRSGHHCAMPIHERFNISASTRASVYLYNNRYEIDILVQKLKKIKKIFR